MCGTLTCMGDTNYYKMLQSAGKRILGRTGVDGRLLYCIRSRNIRRVEQERTDKFTMNCESVDTDTLDNKEDAGNITTETEIVFQDQH